MENFYATGDNSDTDSVAELEYNTWNDTCAWEFWSASGNSPPGLIQNPPTEIIRNTCCYTDDDESPGKFGNGGYVDGGMHTCSSVLFRATAWSVGQWDTEQ